MNWENIIFTINGKEVGPITAVEYKEQYPLGLLYKAGEYYMRRKHRYYFRSVSHTLTITSFDDSLKTILVYGEFYNIQLSEPYTISRLNKGASGKFVSSSPVGNF